MSAISTLLDRYKAAKDLGSDLSLARSLDVTAQTVSQYRKGVAFPSEERIAEIAAASNENPAAWLVAVRAERSSGAAAKAYRALANTLGIAALLCLTTAPAIMSGIHLTVAYYVK